MINKERGYDGLDGCLHLLNGKEFALSLPFMHPCA